MRTFISIDMPEEVKREIQKIQNSLPKFYGKFIEPENLHLTLKFLGEIDERKVGEIKKKLKKIKLNKFETEIDSVGVFSEKFIRIIWLYLANCEGLQKKIDESLISLFESEKRFMSHLTIARVKKINNKYEFFKNLKEIKIPKIKFRVENFKLKKSILTEHKPIYETFEKYNLN